MWPRPGNRAPPEAQTVRKGFSRGVQKGRAADTLIGPQEIPSLSAPDPRGHTSGPLRATQFTLGAEYPSQMPGFVGTAPTLRRLWPLSQTSPLHTPSCRRGPNNSSPDQLAPCPGPRDGLLQPQDTGPQSPGATPE